MKCIVTGGKGFIGRHVVSELLGRGFDVVTYDVSSNALPARQNVTAVQDDIRNFERLCRTFDAADFVFHLSGILGTGELFDDPRQAVDINITGAVNVLLASMSTGRSMRIFFPTKHNEWNNVYSMTAQAVEKLGHAYRENMGLDVRVLRFPNVYGPHQKLAPVRKAVPQFVVQALRNHPIEIFGNGDQLIELIYVEDVARSIVDFMLYDGPVSETFELMAGMQLSVSDLARYVISMTGSSSQLVYLPMRRGESSSARFIRTRNVEEVLGPLALNAIEDGMQKTIEWYMGVPATY